MCLAQIPASGDDLRGRLGVVSNVGEFVNPHAELLSTSFRICRSPWSILPPRTACACPTFSSRLARLRGFAAFAFPAFSVWPFLLLPIDTPLDGCASNEKALTKPS